MIDSHPKQTENIKEQLGCNDWAEFEPIEIGRNQNFKVIDERGNIYFYKYLVPIEDEANRIDSILSADRLSSLLGWNNFSPKILAHDSDSQIIIYEFVVGENFAQLAKSEISDLANWAAVGEIISRLHLSNVGEIDFPVCFPNLGDSIFSFVEAIPFEVFWNFNIAELELWRFIHQTLPPHFQFVSESIPTTPVHGDLRLDQIIQNYLGIHLVDWERFSLGDPASDVGMLFGDVISCLFYQEQNLEHNLSLEIQAQRQMALFGTRASEILNEFWQNYSVKDNLEKNSQFLERVGNNICWHLLERISSRAQLELQLSGKDKALLGIALGILSDPVGALSAFGVSNDQS